MEPNKSKVIWPCGQPRLRALPCLLCFRGSGFVQLIIAQTSAASASMIFALPFHHARCEPGAEPVEAFSSRCVSRWRPKHCVCCEGHGRWIISGTWFEASEPWNDIQTSWNRSKCFKSSNPFLFFFCGLPVYLCTWTSIGVWRKRIEIMADHIARQGRRPNMSSNPRRCA